VGSEFFTRKIFSKSNIIEVPFQSGDQVLEIIVNSRTKKVGALQIRVDDLLELY
jgi:hypothetical protein